jgi:methylated-DNA-[protein]-cysteine S-methyltransferase
MINLYAKSYDGVWFGVACDGKSVFATAFAPSQKQVLRSLLKSIPFNVPFQFSKEGTVFTEQVIATLKDVYDGKGAYGNFSLAMKHLSIYSQKVLEVTAKIPVGYVSSYGAIAKVVGGSPRAVGRVMALNPFPLIIPCHRVVASDFTLGGYGGGLNVKLEILNREKRGYSREEKITIDGGKLQIYPVELVLEKLQKKR